MNSPIPYSIHCLIFATSYTAPAFIDGNPERLARDIFTAFTVLMFAGLTYLFGYIKER